MTDAAFRRVLVEDPRGALERELGVRLPAGVTLAVVEETPTRRYLILPPGGRAATTGELSDEELGAVAGGFAVTYQDIPSCVGGDLTGEGGEAVRRGRRLVVGRLAPSTARV